MLNIFWGLDISQFLSQIIYNHSTQSSSSRTSLYITGLDYTTWQNSVTHNAIIRLLEILDEAQTTIPPYERPKIAKSCRLCFTNFPTWLSSQLTCFLKGERASCLFITFWFSSNQCLNFSCWDNYFIIYKPLEFQYFEGKVEILCLLSVNQLHDSYLSFTSA